jgi:hypothetical protein
MAKIICFRTKKVLAELPYKPKANFGTGQLRLVDLAINESERCMDCLVIGLDVRLENNCPECSICGAKRTAV